MQAATAAAPARQARVRGRSWIWVAVPAALLAAGVAIIDLVPQGPHALALVATFGTPVLAAAGGLFRGSPRWWLWPPVVVGVGEAEDAKTGPSACPFFGWIAKKRAD